MRYARLANIMGSKRGFLRADLAHERIFAITMLYVYELASGGLSVYLYIAGFYNI